MINNNSLEKIIKSIVLPQFPWIDDYEILDNEAAMFGTSRHYYRINYFIFPDKDGTFTVTEDMNEVEELTKSLFRMLGPERDEALEGVGFYTKQK